MIILFSLLCLFFTACTFDYGDNPGLEKTKPDIVMEDIEYVRVRGGDPLVRFTAEYAERWEDRNTMNLKNFTFDQMEDKGETINASGRASTAVVQLGSGNIDLDNGVRISIESEDIIIYTMKLEWKDKEKILSGGPKEDVDIQRSDGTNFIGRGFTANIRNRTWTFIDEVKGIYVEKDDDEDTPEEITINEDNIISASVVTHGTEELQERSSIETPRPTEEDPDEPQILPEEPLPSFVEEK